VATNPEYVAVPATLLKNTKALKEEGEEGEKSDALTQHSVTSLVTSSFGEPR